MIKLRKSFQNINISSIVVSLDRYNIPGRTGVDLLPETTAICAEHPNVVGLKDATGDLDRVHEIRSLTGENFLMYSGNDDTSANFVMRGGDGCM